MRENQRRTIGGACLILGLACLYGIVALSALHAVGTDAVLYRREQTRAGILAEAGVSEEALRRLDGALADYLLGDEAALLPREGEPGPALSATVFGKPQSAFNDRELSHLEDCARLFALLRKVRKRLIPWAILLVLLGARLLNRRGDIRLCALISPLLPLLPLGAFALWAALDFDGAFVFFHRLLFDNDLWLLDPETDLLIRLCPEQMFQAMGARIALISLAGIAGVVALIAVLTAIWPKGKEDDNTWNNRDMRRASAQKQFNFKGPGTR